MMVLVIGVVMLQGARHEHMQALRAAAGELGAHIEIAELRSAEDVYSRQLDALVFPGGESTTMRKASVAHGLLDALFDWMDEHPDGPVLGTCAGAILLCDPQNNRGAYVDALIDRNAYGRQKDSFQTPISVSNLKSCYTDTDFPGVFIRAPRFSSIGETSIEVAHEEQDVVGIRQANRMALTFHPELTGDYRFHRWLIETAGN